MNLPGFFAPSAAVLFALIAPLVLFYFLKLKRPHMLVPSLVLWKQVLQDSRVNSPFQRFKRNILLLLQLLLLILIVLAAMQPYWRGEAGRAERLPILIDVSASMAALDKPGGQSRLDAVKRQVREIIDGMLPDQQLCLLTFGRTAHRLTGFTDNQRVLHAAVDSIEMHDVVSDVDDALRMTQALARREPFDHVLMLTDGNIPAQADTELSFRLDYQPVAKAGQNMGITALTARRSTGGGWDVFVRIDSTAEYATTATMELVRDGQVTATEVITVSKDEAERLVFPVSADQAVSLQVRLKPDDFDALASDNIAFLDLAPPRRLAVYVPAEMVTYRLAMRAMDQVRLYPREGADEPDTFDLVISDQPDDADRIANMKLLVAVTPDPVKPLTTTDDEPTTVIDWHRTNVAFEHVTLTDLIVLDNVSYNENVGDGDLEALGYEVIAHGRFGPVMLQHRQGPRLTYYMLFHSDRSTFPYRVGFPVFVSNLVRLAMQQAGLAETPGHRTGVLPELELSPSTSYRVNGPQGVVEDSAASDANGILGGVATERVGRYTIERDGSPIAQVGASLLSASETLMERAEQIQFRELAVGAGDTRVKMDQSFWHMLAMIALFVLMIEWWYFHRKPGGFDR
jgi:hypothetical protein